MERIVCQSSVPSPPLYHEINNFDSFTKRINELSKDESDVVLEYLYKHIANNHDFQVRHKWTVNGILP